MSAIAHEIERDDVLKSELWEVYRSKYGYVSSNTTVTQMVRMLSLEETIRRIESRHAELRFDGKRLMWGEIGHSHAWPAYSGKPGFEGKQYQAEVNIGPIPEGRYVARQSRLQRWENYPLLDRRRCIIRLLGIERGSGTWPGCTMAWGERRVWLEPRPGTQTFGRDNFSIHGGDWPGSIGCIDLTSYMPDFVDAFVKYGMDMDVVVSY